MSADSITQRLLRAEADLLDAIALGEAALTIFTTSWEALERDITRMAPQLSNETHQLACAVVSQVALIAEQFYELDSKTSALQADATARYEAISLRHESAHSSKPSASSSRSKQVESGYRWLAKNLHNPYPSAAVKRSLAEETGSSLKNIDEWFQRARRRIGWNDLCKKRYSNSRAAMLLVAHRHFIEEDPQHPVTPDMRMEFSEIEMRATHMYNDRYHVSDECRKLGAMVKTASKSQNAKINTTSLRSSSIASTSSSASLKSTGKRRRDAVEHKPSTPCSKRSRSDDSDLFSPSPSPSDATAPWNMPEDLVSPTSTVATLPTPSRKRRLSEADAADAPKRPKGMSMAPRAQAVSAPIPKSASCNDLSRHDELVAARMAFRSAEDIILSAPSVPTAPQSLLPVSGASDDMSLAQLQEWLNIPESAASVPPTSTSQPAPSIDFNMGTYTNDANLVWPSDAASDTDALAALLGFDKAFPPIEGADAPSAFSLNPPQPASASSSLVTQPETTMPSWDFSMLSAPADSFMPSVASFGLFAGGDLAFPDPSAAVLEPVVPGLPMSFGAAASLADPMGLTTSAKVDTLVPSTEVPLSREALKAQITAQRRHLEELIEYERRMA